MGYRSQVHSLIYGPTPEVTKLIALEKLKPFSVFVAFEEHITVNKLDDGGYDETIITLIGDDWKWYDTYDDIIAWNNLMAEAKENPKLSVEFCRVGESSDDVEVETYGGKIHVEWDPTSAVTPIGQLVFFIEFLKLGGRFGR